MSDEERAREIVWNWRCDCFSHCTRECREKLVASALAEAKRQGFAEGVNEAAKVADEASPHHFECGMKIARKIRALAPPREPEKTGGAS